MSQQGHLEASRVSKAVLRHRLRGTFGGGSSPVEGGQIFAPDVALSGLVMGLGEFSIAAQAVPLAVQVRRLPEGFACLCLFVEEGTLDDLRRARLMAVGPRTSFAQPFPGLLRACLGFILRPGAGCAVLRVPVDSLLNRIVPLEDLWGAAARDLLDRMAAARCRHRALTLLEEALRDRAAPLGEDMHFAVAAARLIDSAGGRLTAAELSARLGYSQRQTRRCLAEHVGMGTKLYARTSRLRATVLRSLRQSELDLIDLAHSCGYADQSHLTHEFADLIGVSPGRFLSRLRSLGPQENTEGIFFLSEGPAQQR